MKLAEYARHRKAKGLPGGTVQAVIYAIKAGRLTKSVGRGPSLRKIILDADAADREWAANTDLSKTGAEHQRASLRGRTPDAPATKGSASDSSMDDMSIIGAATREKHWKAKQAELKFREQAGELVNARDMEDAIATTFSNVRTRLLGVPSKLKRRVPGLSLEVIATLDDLIREALIDLVDSDVPDHPRHDPLDEFDDEDDRPQPSM